MLGYGQPRAYNPWPIDLSTTGAFLDKEWLDIKGILRRK